MIDIVALLRMFSNYETAQDNVLVAAADEIEQCRGELSKWKARAQLMREWMLDRELSGCDAAIAWWAFVEERPEAAGWFYDDGTPR
jgi:hypothetical protein